MSDDVDKELELGLENTSESWKRALVVAARDNRNTARLVLTVAVLTLAVALVTLIVTLVK
jgi:hypothetical protein